MIEPQQFFRRQAEGMLLVHRRNIIEPVEIRDRLQVSLGFDQFFGPAMQEADMRVHSLDHFPIEIEHQTQHAMRRRVLRPEIHGESAQLGFRHDPLAIRHSLFAHPQRYSSLATHYSPLSSLCPQVAH